jgi:hypothetical protein
VGSEQTKRAADSGMFSLLRRVTQRADAAGESHLNETLSEEFDPSEIL